MGDRRSSGKSWGGVVYCFVSMGWCVLSESVGAVATEQRDEYMLE